MNKDDICKKRDKNDLKSTRNERKKIKIVFAPCYKLCFNRTENF